MRSAAESLRKAAKEDLASGADVGQVDRFRKNRFHRAGPGLNRFWSGIIDPAFLPNSVHPLGFSQQSVRPVSWLQMGQIARDGCHRSVRYARQSEAGRSVGKAG